jgi:carboxylate-amine ligase
VEVRICDAQSDGDESFGLAGLMIAAVAQAAADHDDGRLAAPLRPREVEENLWRAIRHGLDGMMIDFGTGTEIATPAAVEELLEWTAPARSHLGIDLGGWDPTGPNGAQRARAELERGGSVADAYRSAVDLTAESYLAGSGG